MQGKDLAVTSPLSTRACSIVAGLLCVLLYAPPAVLTPFFTKGEPREALVVRKMIEDGDWLLPKRASANGWTIASKPPFFHWLGAAASEIAGGLDEWTVRVPSLVLATASVLFVGTVAATTFGAVGALAAMLILASSFEWVRAASTARVDGTLTALMTIGTLIFYRGAMAGGLTRRNAVIAYLALACAALTKGPVGFVLPGLVLVTALATQRELRHLPRFRPILGAFVIIAVVGGWYTLAAGLGGDSFVRKQILKENVFRFLGATQMKSGHSHPFYYYFPTLLAGLLPWTPFVIAAMLTAVRNASARRDVRLAFPLTWFAVVFVFYSLADAKRSVYLLALYPAAALVGGWWWSELVRGTEPARWLAGKCTRLVAAVLCGMALVPLLSTLAEGVGLQPLGLLAPFLAPKDRANLPLVRGIIDTHFWLMLSGTAAMVGALLFGLRALRRHAGYDLLIAHTVFAAALWTLIFTVFQPELARLRTLAPFMRNAAVLAAGRPLAFYPRSFDFGAMFYAPPGTRHWKPGRHAGPGPHYLLIWDTELANLPQFQRKKLTILDTSEGTDPRGRQHLVLARRDS
jgi:4-amino-4-deoxy-L-arabinose transferase-like glycosyltransferase